MKVQASDNFLILQQFLTSNGVEISEDIKFIFVEHSSRIIILFTKHFENENIDKFSGILDPFNASSSSEFTSTVEENRIE